MRSWGRARRLGVSVSLAVALLGTHAARAHAETPIPEAPSRWVTDAANFLSPEKARTLDERLARYAADTGHQVLVYVDRTTGGVPIEDWAVRAFARWKVGRHGIDDGLVLYIFSDDRHLRIEVGYGLEEKVTDLVASHIISDRIVPRIRAGDRDGAIEAGVSALLATIGGERNAPPGSSPVGAVGDEAPPPKLPWWAIVGGIVALLFFLRLAARHPMLAALMMTSIGSGRGGGASGGGGFSGGGGGGFSGGGGSSGGGGASGSW